MNYFMKSQNQKHSSPNSKHSKKRLTHDQVRHLEASFSSNKKLEPELKLQLSRQLAIPPRQIAIWYQNRRTRWKNQTLELDHNTLQIRLQAALAEKKQLEKEVERLREELHKSQAHNLSASISTSTCCDDDVNCSWVNVNDGVLQVEELYAYYMTGANGSNCC